MLVTSAPAVRKSSDIDMVVVNLHRFIRGTRAQNRWAAEAKKAIQYVEGDQWDEQERQARKTARRPCLTINKLAPLVRLVLGYAAQNKRQISYRPGNAFAASEAVSDVLNRVSQAIDATSQVNWQYLEAEVMLDGLLTGRGYFDQRISFDDNMLGEIVMRAPDPFTIVPDPEAESYDPAGWGFVCEAKWLSLDDVHRLYGKVALKKAVSSPQYLGPLMAYNDYAMAERDLIRPPTYFGGYDDERPADFDMFWSLEGGMPGSDDVLKQASGHLYDRARKMVRLVETQYKVHEKGLQFVDIVTGRTLPINPEIWTREKINAALAWSEMTGQASGYGQTLFVREAYHDVWYWMVTAGDQMIWHKRSPYPRPTIVPYFAYFRRGATRGMIHDLLDPQTEINKRRSNMAEVISKLANGGWIHADDALSVEQEANLDRFGSTPGVRVKYKSGKEPPQQIQPGMPPRGQNILEEQATADLKEIAGINDAALGQLDKVESGRAIIARQRSTVVGIEPYQDNLNRSLKLVGEQRLELLQTFYTEERVFRLRGDDGRDEVVSINARLADGSIANDITQGSYACIVDNQPLTATFEDAAFDSYLAMVEKGIPVPPDEIMAVAPIPNRQRVLDKVLAAQQAQQQAAQVAAAAQGQVAGTGGAAAPGQPPVPA